MKILTEKHRLKISIALKGRVPKCAYYERTDEYKKKMSMSCMGKNYGKSHPHTEAHKKHMSDIMKGEKNHQWRGGIKPIHRRIRHSLEYRQWRNQVFIRDNWTCQSCLIIGGDLQVDHIKPFSDYPELRFDINNGRTLCKSCHIKTETWGSH
jgi:hypothetical protein